MGINLSQAYTEKCLGSFCGDSLYGKQHLVALQYPRYHSEQAIVALCNAYIHMCESYKDMESVPAHDGVFSDYIKGILLQAKGLLDYDIGRLDSGLCQDLFIELLAQGGWTDPEKDYYNE